jgi:hypothetical protein
MFFSYSFFSKYWKKYKNMTAEEIATYMYNYFVNKTPMKINKFDTIIGVITVKNVIIFRIDTNLKNEMYFINPKIKREINFKKKMKKILMKIIFLEKF